MFKMRGFSSCLKGKRCITAKSTSIKLIAEPPLLTRAYKCTEALDLVNIIGRIR